MLCPETAGLHDVETVATVSLCVGRYEKKIPRWLVAIHSLLTLAYYFKNTFNC